MSIAFSKFQEVAICYSILGMQIVSETRRNRLEMLIKKHGSIAELNTALGLSRTDPKLALIRNANKRGDRAKPHQMGDAMAREIEEKLSLGTGWMDTPPSYAELHGEEDPRTKVMQLMEAMPPDQWQTAVRLLDALAKPTQATGTTGQ
jgi:hypothetical protein